MFAKTDIQPLINEGATTADLAASIFQAVVNQTISGLACGKPIRGCVAFLGGPLHFLPELKKAFIRTLKLTPETTVDPENSHLFAAMGAALESGDAEAVSMDGLIDRLDKGVEMAFELKRLDPLFATREDHQAFCARHSKAVVRRESLSVYRGDCFLGIDAGSTTTKVALIGSDGPASLFLLRQQSGQPHPHRHGCHGASPGRAARGRAHRPLLLHRLRRIPPEICFLSGRGRGGNHRPLHRRRVF